MALAAVVLVLSACGGASPRANTDSAADTAGAGAASTSGGCPAGLVTDLEAAHGTSTEYDLSVIDDALAVDLPDAPACVLTVAGDTSGSTAFYAYFPSEDQSFADSVGQAMLDAGYRPASDSPDYSSGGADARVDVYPAGDPNWSEYFDDAAVVLLAGQFDGAPGMVGSAAPGAGSGETLTWESACALTLDEVNSAWAETGYVFSGPAASGGDSTSCEYEAPDSSGVPLDLDVDFRAYDPSATYGWTTGATSSWTAPSAAEGAANACAGATGANSYNAEATCTDVGGSGIVVGAGGGDAVIFPAGEYFWSVQVFNVSGEYTQPLLQLATLLAARQPTAQ